MENIFLLPSLEEMRANKGKQKLQKGREKINLPRKMTKFDKRQKGLEKGLPGKELRSLFWIFFFLLLKYRF